MRRNCWPAGSSNAPSAPNPWKSGSRSAGASLEIGLTEPRVRGTDEALPLGSYFLVLFFVEPNQFRTVQMNDAFPVAPVVSVAVTLVE